MGAYMIFKLKCNAVDMKTRVIDIQNRYDDKYIDVTLNPNRSLGKLGFVRKGEIL